MPSPHRTVRVDSRALEDFLDEATDVYRDITSESPLPCFGILIGTVSEDEIHVREVAFGENSRGTDPCARAEFSEEIVPRFGSSYENPVRAWWISSADLLQISLQAYERDLDVVGSIHLHPDWHRIGPESERLKPLSERPTAMDSYLFEQTGWDVNMICYVERLNGDFYYSLGTWSAASTATPMRLETLAEPVSA